MRYLCLLACLLFASCASVTCDAPLGEKPVLLAAADYDGTWLTDDAAFLLEVADTNGLLRLTWIEPAPENPPVGHTPAPSRKSGPVGGRKVRPPPVMKSALAEIRSFKDWRFASLRDPDHPEVKAWYWALMEKTNGLLHFRTPEANSFSNLVARGVLPGRVEGASVVLGALDSAALERLRQETNLALWETNTLNWRRHGR